MIRLADQLGLSSVGDHRARWTVEWNVPEDFSAGREMGQDFREHRILSCFSHYTTSSTSADART